MQVNIIPASHPWPQMSRGAMEESWQRILDFVFADAIDQALQSLTVYWPRTELDNEGIALRSAFLPSTHSGATGALWIGNTLSDTLSGFSRIYWLHQTKAPRGFITTLTPVKEYAIWTNASRWWGLGVRLADLIHATSLRDRCMSRSQAHFVATHVSSAQFYLHIYNVQEVSHVQPLAASPR
ncbi:MAG: hypothetical protein C7B44_11720 [Sulfobacillus thermosulfidooxidans]|nr:MAG: hypothetical protein C7B44_11720 [Sulfobacillus thermosulfidooxidans]